MNRPEIRKTLLLPAIFLCSWGTASSLPAQTNVPDMMNMMDHGPFVSTTVTLDPLSPRAILAHKGIAVRVASDPEAVVTFDTDLLRVAGAWTGGLLHWYRARDSLQEWPSPGGFLQFTTGAGPGWSRNRFRSFPDPRVWPYGPLPETWGRYHGLYLHEDEVVFSYTFGESDILETPGFVRLSDLPVFTRTLNLNSVSEPLGLRVVQVPEGRGTTIETVRVSPGNGYVAVRAGSESRAIGFRGLPEEAAWRIADHHLILDLPAVASPLRLEIAIGPLQLSGGPEFLREHVSGSAPVRDLAPLLQPGRARYDVVHTTAVTGTDTGPFAVDVLPLPEDNPWNSYVRPTGVDFLSDGRAVVSSLSGDVWLVSGISEPLGTIGWKRYATGLNQPLGVRVVDDRIYVTGRDQITLLHDRNGDDEADFYESFNNEIMAGWNYHEFTMHLESDSQGNFYFAKSTPWPPYERGRNTEITPHHGVLFRLSPDGSDLQVIATGMRNPNGLAVGPNDQIVYTDQQGHWMPTSNVHLIREGGFYGFVPSSQREEAPTTFENPIVWTPQDVDNSPGSPIWITSQTWPAELHGGLLLGSYGRANLSLMLTETVHGEMQGGFLNLPLEFEAGLLRGRFGPDGHLYVNGLTIWQSTGAKAGAFHRVRYTGRPLHLPVGLNVKANGIVLRFSDPLDPVTARDPASYELERWNYRWTSNYGSPRLSVVDPEREGTDPVTVQSVQLGEDGRTVFLEISDMRPVMNMSISYTLRAADGTEMQQSIYNTIHRVPDEPWRE